MIENRTIEEIFEKLCEQDAIGLDRYDGTSIPIANIYEFYRMWEEISPDDAPMHRKALEDFTSEKSLPYDKKKSWVKNPMINQEEVPGIFRNAGVLEKRSATTSLVNIVQLLRRGFIQNIVVGGSLDLSEARIRDIVSSPADDTGTAGAENYKTIFIPGIDPTRISAIETQIQSIYRTEVAVRIGDQNFGDMYLLNYSSKEEDDGTHTLFLYVANPRYTLTGFNGWNTRNAGDITYHYNVPKVLAQEILTNSKTSSLSGHVVGYDESKGLVDIALETNGVASLTTDFEYDGTCRYNYRDIKAYRLTEEEKDALVATWNTGVPGRKVKIDIEEEGDRYHVSIFVEYLESFHVNRYTNRHTFSDIHESEQFLGYTEETIPPPPARQRGIIHVREKKKLDNCLWDVDDNYFTRLMQEAENQTATASYVKNGLTVSGETFKQPFGGIPGPNVRNTVERQEDEYGRYTNNVQEEIWYEDSSSSKREAAGFVETTTRYINASEKTQGNINGKIVTAVNSPNDHGTNTSEVSIRENKRMAMPKYTALENYAQKHEATTVYNDYIDAPTPTVTYGSDGVNMFYELIRSQMGEDGKQTHTLERRTKKKVDQAATYDNFDSDTRHEETTEKLGQANTTGKVVELSATGGTSKRAAVRYDPDFNTLDVTEVEREDKEYTVPPGRGGVLTWHSKYEKRYRQITRGLKNTEIPQIEERQTADLSVDPETGSAIHTAERTYVYPMSENNNSLIQRGDGTETKVDIKHNQLSVPDLSSAGAGKIKRISGLAYNKLVDRWNYMAETESVDPGSLTFTITDTDYKLAWHQSELKFKKDVAAYERLLNIDFTPYGDYNYMLSRPTEDEEAEPWAQTSPTIITVDEYDYRNVPYISTTGSTGTYAPTTSYNPSQTNIWIKRIDEVMHRVYKYSTLRCTSIADASEFLANESDLTGGKADDYRTHIEIVNERESKYIAHKWNQWSPDSWEWEPVDSGDLL